MTIILQQLTDLTSPDTTYAEELDTGGIGNWPLAKQQHPLSICNAKIYKHICKSERSIAQQYHYMITN